MSAIMFSSMKSEESQTKTTNDSNNISPHSSGDVSSVVSHNPDNRVVVKVALIGDAQVGKTSLMVKYVENKFDEDYIQSLGVNFMEKSISLRNTDIFFSIWDLGGQREFLYMLPIACNDASAIFFMFDLSRKSTLLSIKEWYRQARGLNRVSSLSHSSYSLWPLLIIPFTTPSTTPLNTIIPPQHVITPPILIIHIFLSLHPHVSQNAHAFLVGTKYDIFSTYPTEEQTETDKLARKYAKAMKASLIFTSASHSINIQKMFKVVLSKVFELKTTIPEIGDIGAPILLFT